MPSFAQDLSIVVDGVESSALDSADELTRAVIISLFTWRRANPDDPVEGAKMGWFGDAVATVKGDKIGSRLWLLAREKLTAQTFRRAEEYARESLQWLVDDGVASRVDVSAERYGLDGLAMLCTLNRLDGRRITLRFADVWRIIQTQ